MESTTTTTPAPTIIIYNVVAIWAGPSQEPHAVVMVSYRNENDAVIDAARRNRDEDAGGFVSYVVDRSELKG